MNYVKENLGFSTNKINRKITPTTINPPPISFDELGIVSKKKKFEVMDVKQ